MAKSAMFCFLMILVAFACNAQQLKKQELFAHKDNKAPIVMQSPLIQQPILNNQYPVIKYSCPKGGIFCQMESAIHQHLSFWIKFRMGTDDRYSD